MALKVQPVRRPEWSPVPQEGCLNVESKALLALDHLGVAMLKFGRNGTIHPHPAPFDIDVVCLEGQGMTSVDDEQAAISAGQLVRWPANAVHRLWTEEHEMMTLMLEHVGTRKGT